MEEKQELKARTILREFCLNTSVHGLSGIARSQSIVNRVYWSVTCIGFIALTIYFCVETVREYFKYPFQTVVSINLERPAKFPAFTFCNVCPLRIDHFVEPFSRYMLTRNISIRGDMNYFNDDNSLSIRDYLNTRIDHNESINDYFYSLESMLISCKYNNIPCNASDFIWFLSTKYGICYTFNARLKGVPDGGIRDSNSGGQRGILKLAFYVHSHLYVPYMTDTIGIVAILHDNIEVPEIDLTGMNLGTGRKHTLSFTKKAVNFLPAPYTRCIDFIPDVLKPILDDSPKADYGYSALLCTMACTQTYTYEQCGCLSPIFPRMRLIVLQNKTQIVNPPLCNVSNTCYPQAVDSYFRVRSIHLSYCPNCLQECKRIKFNILSTSSTAPPVWLFEKIKIFVENSRITPPSDWNTNWQTHIQLNYVAVDVIRESDFIENFTQVASLTAQDVLSNVGGHTGLWIGVSCLTLVELFELFYRLLESCVCRNRRAVWKKSATNT